MLKKVKKQIQFFFGFSRTEANGFILLIIILLIVTTLPIIVGKITNIGSNENNDELLDSLVTVLNESITYKPVEDTDNDIEYVLFNFDPNEASFLEFKRLGMDDEIGHRIIKYREKGGKFYNPSDLKKIYGLSDATYKILEPYIKITVENSAIEYLSSTDTASKFFITEKEESTLEFDINSVDSINLREVNGIGIVLSGRIIRFREMLGGFVSLDQLTEVYGLEDYAYLNLLKSAIINSDFSPEKININKDSLEELASHPYLDFTIARVIIAYREQHGEYKSTSDLLNIQLIDKQWLEKISPYLEV